jgi:hypothetical protein
VNHRAAAEHNNSCVDTLRGDKNKCFKATEQEVHEYTLTNMVLLNTNPEPASAAAVP